jgi:hypothetical protein
MVHSNVALVLVGERQHRDPHETDLQSYQLRLTINQSQINVQLQQKFARRIKLAKYEVNC